MKEENENMKADEERPIGQKSTPQKRLYEEFSNFLKKNSVYETIPENMKVFILDY